MALNWPTFFTRLGSAIVFCAIMMTGLLWHAWAFVMLILLIQALCLREYFRLACRIFPDTKLPGWVQPSVQAAGLLAVLLPATPMLPAGLPQGVSAWPLLMCIPAAIFTAAALTRGSLTGGLLAAGGLVYITLPMALLPVLYLKDSSLPLALILLIWTNDTMAYLVGSFIGKTPFSAISPKKTWEGTGGGAVLTILAALVWGYFSQSYTLTDWIALSLCASVAGTAGDLLESRLKRLADVKDSGTMMPGHGGALDRFDSLLVAAPFACAYAYLCM